MKSNQTFCNFKITSHGFYSEVIRYIKQCTGIDLQQTPNLVGYR